MNAETLKELLANATPGPWSYSQCSCGHPSCNQQIMDNQGNVGFSEPDARLIALAPQLAADNIALQAEVERLRKVLSLTRRADELREFYHSLPNEHNRIGDKRSRKSHARDAWLRAFRKAARAASTALNETQERNDDQ